MKRAWRWRLNVFCTKVMYFVFYFISSFFHLVFFIFLSKLRKFVKSGLCTIFPRGNKHFDVHLRRIRSVPFLSRDGKGASYEGRDGWKSCLFPAWVGIFDFDVIRYKVLFPILYLDLACKQLCFPPRKAWIEEMKVQKTQLLFLFCSTDDNTQYC